MTAFAFTPPMASAVEVGSEVILADSFENPDVAGQTDLDPAGWLQATGTHSSYVGLRDEENGQYFTSRRVAYKTTQTITVTRADGSTPLSETFVYTGTGDNYERINHRHYPIRRYCGSSTIGDHARPGRYPL